jgi:hypothetical protein
MISASNAPPQRNSQALWSHFSDTYFSLRMGLAVLAFTFPLVLYFYGKYRHGVDLQPSMSAYFFAATTRQCASFPMRTIFVGFLFAIGAGLYLYKGFTDLENILLNVAGVCAAVVAIVPERLSADHARSDARIRQLFQNCPAVREWADATQALPIHYLSAVLLFVILAIVAWACAYKTLDYLPAGKGDPVLFRRTYRTIAGLMVLCPLSGWLLARFLSDMSTYVFFLEAAGIWTFGAYWAVKSRELALSRLEKDPREAVRNARPSALRSDESPHTADVRGRAEAD